MAPIDDTTCLPTPILAKSKRQHRIVPRFLRTEYNTNFSATFQPRIALYFHDSTSQHNIAIAQTLRKSHLKASVLLISTTLANEHQNSEAGIIRPKDEDIFTAITSFNPDIFIVEQVQLRTLEKILQHLKNASTQCVLSIANTPQLGELDKHQNNLIKKFIDELWLYSDAQVCNLTKAHRLSKQSIKKVRYTGYLQSHKTPDKADENSAKESVWIVLEESLDFTKTIEFILKVATENNISFGLLLGPAIPGHIKHNLCNIVANADIKITTKQANRNCTKTLENAKKIIVFGNKKTIIEALGYKKNTLLISQKEIAPFNQIRRFEKIKNTDVLPVVRTKAAAIADWITSTPAKNTHNNQPHIDIEGLTKLPTLIGKLLTNERRKTQRHTREEHA